MQHPVFTYLSYEQMISIARECGYSFVSFEEFSKDDLNSNQLCLLRHDCDNDLPAALRMARLENKMGVSSTYFLTFHAEMYNLQSVSNIKLAREIVSLGHHIGLHFDHGFYAGVENDDVADFVEYERSHLESLLDVSVGVMSFHQPSEDVLHQKINVRMMNTYSIDDMRGAYYISDSNMAWRERTPVDIFTSGEHEHVHLLIHPEWWAEDNDVVSARWASMFEDNFMAQQETLITLEKSYNQVFDIKIVPK